MKVVWERTLKEESAKSPSSLTSQAAIMLQIPAIAMEAGGEGRLDEPSVNIMYEAFVNVMKHLRMIAGKPSIPVNQLYAIRGHWLRAPCGGLVWQKVKLLERVSEGQTIAVITDLFGNERATLVSPANGVVIGLRTLGVTNLGEYVANVSEVK